MGGFVGGVEGNIVLAAAPFVNAAIEHEGSVKRRAEAATRIELVLRGRTLHDVALFVPKRVDGMNDRGLKRRNGPEHHAHGRGEFAGDRHHPNRKTDVVGRRRLSSDDLVRQAPRTVDLSECLDHGTRMHGHRPRLTIRKGDIPHQ